MEEQLWLTNGFKSIELTIDKNGHENLWQG
jgi:hypothetical protein